MTTTRCAWLMSSAILLLIACGGDDDDGGSPDAAITVGNALGQLCGDGRPDCPTDHTCVIQPVPDGSTTEGYCSPVCQDDPDCTADYAGAGSPVCFSQSQCAIVCTDSCPSGLSCLPTGGPTSVCAVDGP